MIDTVEDPTYGIAYDVYKVPGYHVVAKTGTAQISDGKGYIDGASQVLSSVVEMVPRIILNMFCILHLDKQKQVRLQKQWRQLQTH